MYCRNCGNKLNEESIFCKKCGTKIIRPENVTPKQNYKKNIAAILKNKKNRKVVILISTFLIIILLYTLTNYLFFSEDRVIKRFITAYANNDYETILKLSDTNQNEFMSKKTIQEKYGQKQDSYVKIDIISTNQNKGEHTRTVKYRTLDSSNVMNISIKQAGRKYLIFKKYVITSTDLAAENVTVTISKNSKLLIDNVKITDKYKKKETKNTITYKIPALLKKNVKMEIELNNKIAVTNIKNVYSYENLTTDKLYHASLDSKTNKKIENEIKSAIEQIVNNSLSNNELEKIEQTSIFSKKLISSAIFTNDYNNLKEKYQTKNIKDFKVDSVKITKLNIENDNDLNMKANISYSYIDSNNKKRNTTRSINLTFDYEDDLKIEEFYLSNLYTLF